MCERIRVILHRHAHKHTPANFKYGGHVILLNKKKKEFKKREREREKRAI